MVAGRARFGMFIQWGSMLSLQGREANTNPDEQIRTTAQIPIEEYNQFVDQFNPVKFNAYDRVRMARDAGGWFSENKKVR